MAKWQLVMPDVEPLILHFGLNDFGQTGLIEYWIANEIKANYCGKVLFVFDGQACPMHHHHDKHETFFVVQGKVQMICDGQERIMSSGDILVMDVNQNKHSFTGVGNALLLEISKPCILSDNYFQDTRIPIGGNHRI